MQQLLRTSLFSLLALVLAAGLAVAPAQAQQTPDIIIDQDDLETIDGELDAAQPGDLVRIIAGTYDENVIISTASTGGSLSDGDELTIEIETDGSDQDVRLTQFGVDDGIDLTVRTVDGGDGFVNLVAGGTQPDLSLQSGTFTLNSSSVLEVFGGAQVERTDAVTLSGSAPTFNGTVDAEFVASNGPIDATTSPTIIPNADVDVSVTGSSDNTVTLPSGITIAQLDGSDALDVGASAAATLNGGTVTGSVTNDGTITDDGGAIFQASVDNDGTFTANAGSSFDATVDNDGTLTANAGLTFDGQVDNAGTVDFQSGTSTYNVASAGTFDNQNGTVTIADGATLDVNSDNAADDGALTALTNDGGVTGAGTLTFTGDGNDTFNVDVNGGGAGNEVLADNSGTGGTAAGDITTNRPLTFDEGGTAANAIDVGNITADGAVDFGEGGDDTGAVTTGSLDANNTIDFTVGSATGTVTTGDITADADVNLDGIGSDITTGAVTVSGSNTVDFSGSGSDVSTDGTVTANSDATVDLSSVGNNVEVNTNGSADDDALTVNGTVNLSSVTGFADLTGGVALNSGGSFDATATDLRLNGTLTQASNSTFGTNNNTRLQLQDSATLSHNTITTVGELVFSGQGEGTLNEAIRVDDSGSGTGNMTINGATVLQDNVFMIGGGGGTLSINANLTQNDDVEGNPTFIEFAGGGKTIAGSQASIANVRIDNGGNDVSLGSDVDITDRLELLNGGIDTGGNDLSPGQGALVTRNLANNTGITNNTGTVGGDDNPFDLTYTSGTADVELEFSDDVRDLTVESGATAQLVEDEIVSGVLAVNAGAQIGDDGNGPWEIELSGDVEHTITGLVVQNNGSPVELNVTGDGTLTGSTDDNNESRIEDLTADGTVTVSDIQQIDGDVTVNQGASLDLDLADADQSGIDGDADGTDDQTIAQTLTVNGTLTLLSDVEMTKSFVPATVEVNETGTEGAIEFRSNDLFLTGEGARFIASSDQDPATSPFSANGDGRLVFDHNIAADANAQRIDTDGEAVPNIRIEESEDTSSPRLFMTGDAATSSTLDANEEIDLAGNTFAAGGTATLNDDVSDGMGGGVFRATGNTVTVENDISISQFAVDPGSANTLTLESDDPTVPSNAPFTVGVPNGFELASGSLSHGATDIVVTGSFAYTGSGTPTTEISAGSGFVNLSNAGLSLSLNNALAVTNLLVSLNADLGADGVNLTVRNELEMNDEFDATTSSGSLVMDDGATLQRLSGTDVNGASDPLPEALEVPSSGDKYNVTYGEETNSNYNSAGELVSERISTLTLNTGGTGALYLNEDVSSDNVIVDRLVLNSGDLDYGRQVEINEDGTVIRRADTSPDDAGLADADDATGDNDNLQPAPLVASGTYTLRYDDDQDGVSSGTLTASDREFTSDVSALETTMGASPNSHGVTIGLDRTVGTFTVNNSGEDTQISNSTLTVTGNASVDGGNLTSNGTIDFDVGGTFTASGGGVDVSAPFTADGLVTVNSGATVSSDFTANGGGLTVDGNNSTVSGVVTANGDPDGSESITVRNSGSNPPSGGVTGEVDTDIDITLDGGRLVGTPITTQGDITLEGSGNILAGTSVNVTFDGTTNQTLDLNGQNVDGNQFTLSKTTPQNTPVPTVTVTSGELTTNNDPGLDLNNGLLVVENISDGNAIDLGDSGYDRTDVDPAAGDTSHVVGNVTRNLGDGDARINVTYPVGSANATYRPFQVIFDQGNNVDDNDITIGHKGEATPTQNLPITTASGIIIGRNKPNYYWRTQTDENLGIGQSFQVAATATGLALDEPLAEHRLIRQEEPNGAWEVQGADGQYNNTGNTQTALLRNDESTGGLSPLPRRVTVGVPARPPAFTQRSGDKTVDENAELTANFAAEVQDPSSTEGSIAFSVDAPTSIENQVSIDSTGEGTSEVTYAPDFDDASGSPYTITVIAEDTDQGTTTEATFEATVNNVPAPPAYTAPVSDENVDEGNTVSKTFQAEIRDPGSSGNVIYSVDAPAEIRDSIEVDAQTGEFSYTAGFEDASASNDPTEYDVTAKATDSDAQATRDSTFTISVGDDPIAPTFTQEAGDKETDEGVEVTADFTAEAQDPNSGSDAIAYSVSAPSAIADSVDIDDTGQVSYTPGFDDAADSPYTLTVTAEDTDAQVSTDASLEVTVNETGQAPTFTTAPGSGTVDEGDELTATFDADVQDPGSGSDAIEFAISAPSAIDDSVGIDPSTGELTYTPGFDDAANSPYDIEVEATDTDAQTSVTTTFTATVNNVVQGPVFADGGAPSDFDGTVARDTSRESTNPPTIDVAAQVEDPASAGAQLSFQTDADWASVTSTTADGDQKTATIALEPGFAEAQQAAQGDGTLDVSVTATDGGTGEPVSGVVSVDVGFNPLLGDADGTGDAFSANDAFAALAIAVDKFEIDQAGGLPLLDGHIRAADVAPPSAGDTLDADPDDVNAFDALQILQGPDQNGGAAALAASNASNGSGSGVIQVGEVERKSGTAVVPIRLAKSGTNVQATDIEVKLGSDKASVKKVQANTPDGWISSHNVTDEGVLNIGMAGTQALPNGRIATVRLDVGENQKPFSEGTYQINGAEAKDLPVKVVPSEFALKSNYPNPVQTSTTIEYKLKEARSVTLEVYNTLGQKVATLVDGEKEAGSYSVNWEAGRQVSSGVYFYRIEAGGFTETKRVTVVR